MDAEGLAEAIDRIASLTEDGLANNAKVHEVNGRKFATTSLIALPSPQSQPTALVFASLQGIADFARASAKETYATERGGVFLVIDGPDCVSLHTGLFGDFQQRTLLGRSVAKGGDFVFGRFHAAENFVMALLSQFAPTDDRAKVFALTSSAVSGAAITTEDDGVSQGVTVKKGIDRVRVEIGPGNAFMLAPYASFPEVAVPKRPFVLRMKAGNANAVPAEPHQCALFEADGGVWKVGAAASIKEWLKGELGETVPVYG